MQIGLLTVKKPIRALSKNHYDLCILDVMMPVKDGYTLAREIRMTNADIPIIFLTAKSLKEDIIEGFKAGADDYISKPFSMEELLFRVEAVITANQKGCQPEFRKPNTKSEITCFIPNTQLLKYWNSEQKLTTKESDLLKLLCANKNTVLDRNFALKTIWVDDNYFNARSMDVYIAKLRKYLKDDPKVQIINVHGKGFKLIES